MLCYYCSKAGPGSSHSVVVVVSVFLRTCGNVAGCRAQVRVTQWWWLFLVSARVMLCNTHTEGKLNYARQQTHFVDIVFNLFNY